MMDSTSGTPTRSPYTLQRTPKRTKLMLDIYKELDAAGELTPKPKTPIQRENVLRGHFGSITAVKFHPDPMKNELISAGLDGFILLWDVTNPKSSIHTHRAIRFDGNRSPINDVTFSPKTGDYMLSGSSDQIARVWTPQVSGNLRFVKAHAGPVLSVDWNPTNLDNFITASTDSTIKVWDLSTCKPGKEQMSFCGPIMKPLVYLSGHAGYVNSAKYNSDGSLIVSSSQDRTVRVRDYRGPNCYQQYNFSGSVAHADFVPTSDHYFGAMTEDSFYIYDLRGGRKDEWLQSYKDFSTEKLNKFQFHQTGAFVACVSGVACKFIDLIQGRPVLTIFTSNEIKAVDFSPNLAKVAVGGQEKAVQILESPLKLYSDDELFQQGTDIMDKKAILKSVGDKMEVE